MVCVCPGCILIWCHWQATINIFCSVIQANLPKEAGDNSFSSRLDGNRTHLTKYETLFSNLQPLHVIWRTRNIGLDHILYFFHGLVLCQILCFMTKTIQFEVFHYVAPSFGFIRSILLNIPRNLVKCVSYFRIQSARTTINCGPTNSKSSCTYLE